MQILFLSMLLAVGAPEAGPSPLVTLATEAGVPVAPEALALGVEMARLLNDEEMTLRQATRMFDETMPMALGANAEIADLEKDYPGIVKAMLVAMRPEIEKQVIDSLPRLWNDLGTAYAQTLTSDEMRQMLAFYRGPTGQWLIETMVANSDYSGLAKNLVANPDGAITANDLKTAIQDSAKDDLVRTLNKEREANLIATMTTPAGRKVRALSPRLLQIAAEWSSQSTPEEDARLEAIVDAVVAQFVTAAENDKSRQTK